MTASTPSSKKKKKKYSHRPRFIKKPAPKQIDGVGIKYAQRKTKKKSSSHASNRNPPPIEMSTKQVAHHLKPQIVHNSLYKARDPRFDNKVNSVYDEAKFQEDYSHVYEMKQKEAEEVRKTLKKVKSEKTKQKLQEELRLMDAQNTQLELKQKQRSLEEEWLTRERQATKEGKKRYYLSKAAKKELALVDRFIELKKSGLLKKYIEKRRKRNAAKEHKRMPERPIPDTEE